MIVERRADLLAPSSRRTQAARRFVRRAEAAVEKHAPGLHETLLAARLRWLDRVLREIEPRLRLLDFGDPPPGAEVEERASRDPIDPVVAQLTVMVREVSIAIPDPNLQGLLADLGEEIMADYGFLTRDPRTEALRRELVEHLEGGLYPHWRNLTDPAVLAKRIYDVRFQEGIAGRWHEYGQKGPVLYARIAGEWRHTFYAAERLVRTAYTGGANRAALEEIRRGGYTGKRWISSRDARVRPGRTSKGSKANHRILDGQEVPVDQPFVSPVTGSRFMYPGDRSQGAIDEEIYNCRCTMVGFYLEGEPRPEVVPDQAAGGARLPEEPPPPGAPQARTNDQVVGEIEAVVNRARTLLDRIERDQARIREELEVLRFSRNPSMSVEESEAIMVQRGELSRRSGVLRRRVAQIEEARAERVVRALQGDAAPAQIETKLRSPRRRDNARGRASIERGEDAFRRMVGAGKIDEAFSLPAAVPLEYSLRSGVRAFQSGGSSRRGGGEIVVDSNGPVRTVIHELGHAFEAWTDTASKGADWVVSRSPGESPRRLSDLTGNRGYSAHEVAYKDQFFSPYIGKVYRHRGSEVMSMGLENLYAAPDKMLGDRNYLDYVLDMIRWNRGGRL